MAKIKLSEVEEYDNIFNNNLNEWASIVDDFIMIAGMSPEEAAYAANNVLDYDGI